MFTFEIKQRYQNSLKTSIFEIKLYTILNVLMISRIKIAFPLKYTLNRKEVYYMFQNLRQNIIFMILM